jgi:hypothetical protein
MLQFIAETFALNHFESQRESIAVLAAKSSSRVTNNRTKGLSNRTVSESTISYFFFSVSSQLIYSGEHEKRNFIHKTVLKKGV